MSLPNGEPTRKQLIEAEIFSMAIPLEKPKTFLELCNIVWRAFDLGKQWQIEKDKENQK